MRAKGKKKNKKAENCKKKGDSDRGSVKRKKREEEGDAIPEIDSYEDILEYSEEIVETKSRRNYLTLRKLFLSLKFM